MKTTKAKTNGTERKMNGVKRKTNGMKLASCSVEGIWKNKKQTQRSEKTNRTERKTNGMKRKTKRNFYLVLSNKTERNRKKIKTKWNNVLKKWNEMTYRKGVANVLLLSMSLPYKTREVGEVEEHIVHFIGNDGGEVEQHDSGEYRKWWWRVDTKTRYKRVWRVVITD
jgi:hypothetical protein